MKVLILSSGLGSISGGDERFLLDLAASLRSNGLAVTCWGSSENAGVRRIPTLRRDELEQLALYRIRDDTRLASCVSAGGLADWVLHAEGNLFGLAAAACLDEELRSNEPAVVYTQWQGGLVNAEGRATPLLERLARAQNEGHASTVVAVDRVYPPVIERLAGCGFLFHSGTPWATKQLIDLGISRDSIFELPYGVTGEPLRLARSRRSALRNEFRIPQGALAILGVGAFTSEFENFPYVLRELAPFAKDPNVYWVVAGSRGKEPAAWERQAKELFGERFRPLVGAPLERTPDLYGVADLAVCGSLSETAGLVHEETALSGLPFVMHDSEMTQWMTEGLPPKLTSVSRVDMRAAGALANAVSQWLGVLGNATGREALATVYENFRQAQSKRFSWESLGPQFVDAFRGAANPEAARERARAFRERVAATAHSRSVQLAQERKAGEVAPEPTGGETDTPADQNLASQGPLRILVVHETLPQTDCGGADVRLMQVLSALSAQGHEMTFVARLGLKRERYVPPLEAMGFTVHWSDTDRLKYLGVDIESPWSFEEVLRKGRFDIAILCEWFWTGTSIPEHYMDVIRRVSPRTRIAILSDDRHGLRELRKADLTKRLSDIERGLDFQYRETETYRQADIVLAITEEDRAGFLEITPNLVTELLPMVAEKCAPGPGPARRRHLLFLGSFSNLANLDGLEWFFARIWPLIHERLPEVEMHLAGSSMPERLRALGGGIVGRGPVDDLGSAFAQYRVFISPIRYGTGIKTKNVAAMAHGIPIVTTTIGAEGMGLRDSETISIADDEEAFAEAVVQLYQDDKLWRQRAKAGRAHILRQFSSQKLRTRVSRFIERTRTLQPKAYDPNHVPPYQLVERFFPEVLTHQPGLERPGVRMVAYVHLAERFLAENKPEEALSHFRHAFHYLRGEIPNISVFARLLAGLERCYRELGDLESAERCARARARDSKDIREPVVEMENRGAGGEPSAALEGVSNAKIPADERLSGVLR